MDMWSSPKHRQRYQNVAWESILPRARGAISLLHAVTGVRRPFEMRRCPVPRHVDLGQMGGDGGL